MGAVRPHILRAELDMKMCKFYDAMQAERPAGGWLRATRLSYGMTLAQLGKRMRKSTVTIREIEEREAAYSITLGKLIEAGDALGLTLVYGFHPNKGSLERFVEERAYRLAGRIVRQTSPIAVELHRTGGNRLRQEVGIKMRELKREMPRTFWDEPEAQRRGRRRRPPGPAGRSPEGP